MSHRIIEESVYAQPPGIALACRTFDLSLGFSECCDCSAKHQFRITRQGASDECYLGLGLNGPPPIAQPPCTSPAIPKVNQGYVWSLAVSGDDVWFGTTANP